MYDIVPGLDISPAHPHQAPPSQQSSLKQPRVPVQVGWQHCVCVCVILALLLHVGLRRVMY